MIVPLRLRTIANYIEPNEIVADVGADHGLLELYLIARNSNNKIVAIENKKGPYSILKETLIGLKNIRLSLSSGLTAVDRNVDTVVLAGMGGINICKILNEYPDKVKKLKKIITDAHRDLYQTRMTIVDYKFKISSEKIIYENGKYYVISVFEKAEKQIKYSDEILEFGLNLDKDELWPKYRDYLISQNNKTIEKMNTNPSLKNKILDLEIQNKRILNYGKN